MVLKYLNGNRLVEINLNNGTKKRYRKLNDNSDYNPIYSENIDVNLSYNCNNKCSFCYINSNKNGKIATKENIKKFIQFSINLPKGIEIAVNLNEGNINKKVFCFGSIFLLSNISCNPFFSIYFNNFGNINLFFSK